MHSTRLISSLLTLAPLLITTPTTSAPPPAPKQSLCERIYTHLNDIMKHALPQINATHHSKLTKLLTSQPPIDKTCASAKPVPAEKNKCLLHTNTLRSIKKCAPNYKRTKHGALSKMQNAAHKKMNADKKDVDMNKFKKAPSIPTSAAKKMSK